MEEIVVYAESHYFTVRGFFVLLPLVVCYNYANIIINNIKNSLKLTTF